MAAAQETMAAASAGLLVGDATSEEVFRRAARLNTRRVQYQPGLYVAPYLKDDKAVRDIAESYQLHRSTFAGQLKKRHLEEEAREEPDGRGKAMAAAKRRS